MAAAYTWHPGTDVNSRWAVPVPLLPDEIISSWLVRAALAQGCDPLVLTGDVWPKWRVWTLDPDRGLSDDRLKTLARASGIPQDAFHWSSLGWIAGKILGNTTLTQAAWPWVLQLGTRNRKRHGGLQYCPYCLQEDRTPYFRLQWRLAWHTTCHRHGTCLMDRCPHCNAPIEPHRLEAKDKDLNLCATCKRDLREGTTNPADFLASEFQMAADETVLKGSGCFGDERLNAPSWFQLSRYFVVLLRRALNTRTGGLTAFLSAYGIEMEAFPTLVPGMIFEALPPDQRMSLLSGVHRFLQTGIETFIDRAEQASLTAQALCNRGETLPPCLSEVRDWLPNLHITRKAAQRPANSKRPRSPKTVERMMLRLRGKMEMAARK